MKDNTKPEIASERDEKLAIWTLRSGYTYNVSGDPKSVGNVRFPEIELVEKSAYDRQEKTISELRAALKEVCAPEPDGHGDFVADEFTPESVLKARRLLARTEVK